MVVVDECTVDSGRDGTGAKVTVRRGRGTGAGEVTVGVGSESGWDEDGADDGADDVDDDCVDGCRLDFSACGSAVMSVSTRMVYFGSPRWGALVYDEGKDDEAARTS